MAKKEKPLLESIVEITASVPWWIGIVLAVATYFLFHSLAGIEITNAGTGVNNNQPDLTRIVVKAASGVFQYLAPFAFLLGSAISAISQFKNKRLFESVIDSKNSRTVEDLTWREFERL